MEGNKQRQAGEGARDAETPGDGERHTETKREGERDTGTDRDGKNGGVLGITEPWPPPGSGLRGGASNVPTSSPRG